MAEAGTLHCPRCGGPATTDQLQCTYCHAQLATVACPGCFAKIFVGYEFCPYCGGAVEHDQAEATTHACPRCKKTLVHKKLGEVAVEECNTCAGLWVRPQDFKRIRTEKETHAAVLGAPSHAAPAGADAPSTVRYIPCPSCAKLMNRFNFAQCSGVIVDVCKDHGIWFDSEELRRIVQFIEAGGLDKARARHLEQLHEQERSLKLQQAMDAIPTDDYSSRGSFQSSVTHASSGGIVGSVADMIFGVLFH